MHACTKKANINHGMVAVHTVTAASKSRYGFMNKFAPAYQWTLVVMAHTRNLSKNYAANSLSMGSTIQHTYMCTPRIPREVTLPPKYYREHVQAHIHMYHRSRNFHIIISCDFLVLKFRTTFRQVHLLLPLPIMK